MTAPESLSDAQELLGRRWSAQQPPAQTRILTLARDALDFISATGQWYSLEDFRRRGASSSPSQEQPRGAAHDSPRARGEGGQEGLREQLSEAEAFFVGLLNGAEVAGEKAPVQLILDTLRFIASSGQLATLGDFIKHVECRAPPYVVAAFDTQEEAQAWLESHLSPPVFSRVLIANESHDVVYERETDFRRLPWNRDIHRYLAWLKRVEPPAAPTAFATREEAEEWLKSQSSTARRAWVAIAGELYLAAYYPNINHRVLYPLSMAEGYEDETEEPA